MFGAAERGAKSGDLRWTTCQLGRKVHLGRPGVEAMQSLTLMIVYVATTVFVQFLGFLVSRVIDYQWPTLGLMAFLIMFLGSFFVAWPIAVRLTEWLIRRGGYTLETEQS